MNSCPWNSRNSRPADFDLSLTGFEPRELQEVLTLLDNDEQADIAPPLPENPVSRPNDLWRCGNRRNEHRVLCADAIRCSGRHPAIRLPLTSRVVRVPRQWRCVLVRVATPEQIAAREANRRRSRLAPPNRSRTARDGGRSVKTSPSLVGYPPVGRSRPGSGTRRASGAELLKGSRANQPASERSIDVMNLRSEEVIGGKWYQQ